MSPHPHVPSSSAITFSRVLLCLLCGTWSVLVTSIFGIWLNVTFIWVACFCHAINAAIYGPPHMFFSLYNEFKYCCGLNFYFSMMIQQPNLYLVISPKLQVNLPWALFYYKDSGALPLQSLPPFCPYALNTLSDNNSKSHSIIQVRK